VDVVRKIYAGPHNPRTGEPIFPGWDPGSEAPGGDPKIGWTAYIVGQPEPVRLELWKYWLFGDPDFDWHTFDFDHDLAAAERQLPSMNATSPDLAAFTAHGGKLLMYYGWADNVSSARTAIDYYDSVEHLVGDRARTQAFLRLFLLPGVGHCSGGPGPDRFDRIGILDDWVANGRAPDRIIAQHVTAGRIDRTRPICPYPQSARYSGRGSIDDAANFACANQPMTASPDDGLWLRRLQQSRAAGGTP
jgi:feruloyl esterase